MASQQIDQAWVEYGESMRRDRHLLGFSLRDVAEKAGVSKNTLLRLESGKPIQRNSVLKICKVYNCAPTDPTSRRPPQRQGEHFRLHTNDETLWYALRVNASGTVEEIPDKGGLDAQERERLGHYKLVEFFSRPLRCRREGTRMIPFMVELYGKTDATRDHSGERFVYGIRGDTSVWVGGANFVVAEGEAAMFDSTQLHWFEPAPSMDPKEPGAQLLVVLLP